MVFKLEDMKSSSINPQTQRRINPGFIGESPVKESQFLGSCVKLLTDNQDFKVRMGR
jgi:hypothetical protein